MQGGLMESVGSWLLCKWLDVSQQTLFGKLSKVGPAKLDFPDLFGAFTKRSGKKGDGKTLS